MSNKGSKVGCWIVVAILGVMLFGSFLANIGLVAALFSGSSVSAGTTEAQDQFPQFDEVWSYGQGDAKVVRIGLKGAIMRGQQERLFGSGPDMVELILTQVRAATQDAAVKAILLEVDSPGGAVTPSDEIYAALKQFKRQDEERIILVFVRGLGASGAYYAAMAGDYIMAEPTAIVGSVGVIMQTMNMKGLGEKLGLSSVTIASGENKDMLNPFKEVDPQHMALLQQMVDSMQDRFASIVQDARGLETRALLDGRVFTVAQAMEHNLIDGVGYWDDAVARVADLMGVDDVRVIRYAKEPTFMDNLFSAEAPKIPGFHSAEAPRFLYLWKP